MKKRIFAVILAGLLCLSLLAACSSGGAITAEKAQKIALDYAGLKQNQVSDIHTHIIEQEGVPCIQIHMTTDEGDITVVIDAATDEGDITVVIDAATGEVIGNG